MTERVARELLPCPFCGCTRIDQIMPGTFACDGCGAAAKRWNTRAPPAVQAESVALTAEWSELERAADMVCDYDWSDNDEDAVATIDRLDLALRALATRRRTLASAAAQAAESQDARDAARDVLAERARQVNIWKLEHDDEHDRAEMAIAAVSYALAAANLKTDGRYFWPWDEQWWKPSTPRRNLVKAGALILAEIERLDRAAMKEAP